MSKRSRFYQGVLNSPYVDWLTEYNTNITAVGGQPGTNQAIGRDMASSFTLVGFTRVSIGPAIKVMLWGRAGSPASAYS